MNWSGLPSQIKLGVSGWFHCNQQNTVNVEQINTTWSSKAFSIEIKGRSGFVQTKTGWYIFSLSAPIGSTQKIAEILDKIHFPSKDSKENKNIFNDVALQLTNLMLPEAAIIALQPEQGRACLFRDASGFVPLYYTKEKDKLYFSSNLANIRTLTKYQGINTDKINEMLVYGHRTGKRTLWQNINTVSPGSVTVISSNQRPYHQWILKPESQYNKDIKNKFKQSNEATLLKGIEKALNKALEPLDNEPHISVPCGGGVDSSLLGAYLAARGQKVTFWCINQPEAPVSEEEWMRPLSKKLNIPCEYANLNKELFLTNFIERLALSQQPMTGPNAVGGILARKLALDAGDKIFISGEGADTAFGGLSPFGRLQGISKVLRALSWLPKRLRIQLSRGLLNEKAWLLDMSKVAPLEDLAQVAMGDLERAEMLAELTKIPNTGNSKVEHHADMFSWVQLREVASGLNHTFFEKDELEGGVTHYPFLHAELLSFGLHLPYKYKVNKGHKKWLWRKFASKYIGDDVAFRKKYAFPTLTNLWLESSGDFLNNGFLEDLLCTDVFLIYNSLPKSSPARWTLINIELWGRINCWNESTDEILAKVL